MTTTAPALSRFAADVLTGLTSTQKWLPARYFYDEVGSSLFEVITRLPEYGLKRADERLLIRHSAEIAAKTQGRTIVAELGSGSGTKTAQILRAIASDARLLRYCPIDISATALELCRQSLNSYGPIEPVCGEYIEGLERVSHLRRPGENLMLLFLGSSIGNFERAAMPGFFRDLRRRLQPNDLFLIGADLVKPAETLLAAYDDALGVTAAFNLNVLRRMNEECAAEFDLRTFVHEARWNAEERRIEMHLVSRIPQRVAVRALGITLDFRLGESIWTESSHKFTVEELERFATESGFEAIASWTDREWPFVESLWRAA